MNAVKQASTAAAALKAERERDKAQAMRDYENEQRARQANMERLRALRLAKERADAPAAQQPGGKKVAKAATGVPAPTQVKRQRRMSS